MRSQPTASRQSPDREPDGELHGYMDDCLAVEVAADRGRNERRLLPIIGAVWARETTSEVRRGVDSWSRLDGSGGVSATATEGAPGAGRNVSARSRPASAGMTAVISTAAVGFVGVLG
ncbi:hypothetical protein V6N13_004825 [Hibiscus sabdariffa]|uniref:Uncharacterized protein n=1 Tax=Hibiscus sabdariffa TaxID=183260 RepID=A0ABR2S098_9ROSI